MSGSADALFKRFYQHFLENPAVAEMFESTDMERQVQMLKRSLFHVVAFYVTGSPGPELKRVAEMHRHLALRPEMFDGWLKALIATVKELDVAADEKTLLAWCWALTPGLTYMRLSLEA